MPSDADKLLTAKQYLRRKWSLEKLKTEADNLFDLATEEVTITSQGFEGGSSSGSVSYPKILLMQAIEELILEKDEDAPRAPSGSIYPDYSGRRITT